MARVGLVVWHGRDANASWYEDSTLLPSASPENPDTVSITDNTVAADSTAGEPLHKKQRQLARFDSEQAVSLFLQG